MNVSAQPDSVFLLVVGGVVLLLILVLALYWGRRRRSHIAPPEQSEKSDAASSPIAAPPPQPAAVSLEFAAEAGQHISFTLDKPAMTIGRASDNDIVLAVPVLNADTVSQHHARLRRDQDGYIVRDLGSKNGLSVNGRQTIENLLQDGDRLQLGEVEAIFRQPTGGTA